MEIRLVRNGAANFADGRSKGVGPLQRPGNRPAAQGPQHGNRGKPVTRTHRVDQMGKRTGDAHLD